MNVNIKLREFKFRVKQNLNLIRFYKKKIFNIQNSLECVEMNINCLNNEKRISNADILLYYNINDDINLKLRQLSEINIKFLYKKGYYNTLKEIINLNNLHFNIINKFGTNNIITTFKAINNTSLDTLLPKYITNYMSCLMISKVKNNEDDVNIKKPIANKYKCTPISSIEIVDPFIIQNGLKLLININKNHYSLIMYTNRAYSFMSINFRDFDNIILKIKTILNNKINNKTFINNYIKYLPYTNLMLKTIEQNVDNCLNLFSLYKKNRIKNITTLTKDIQNECFKNQYDIILSLLLDDTHIENIYIVEILLSEINKNKSINYDNIISCMHLSLNNRIIKIKHNININDETDINKYENKILLCKCSENIKSKAYEKNKELNNLKNSENSSKVIQYLDGFLKIPFGIYHTLTIHDEYELFLYNYKNMIDYVVMQKDNIDNNYFDKHIIQEVIDKISYKNVISQMSINSFFNYFNEINNQQYNHLNKKFINLDVISKIFTEKEIFEIAKKYKLRTKIVSNTINKLINDTTFITDYNDHIFEIGSGNKTLFNSIKKQLIMSRDYWNTFKYNQQKYLEYIDSTLDKTVYGMKDAKNQIKRVIGQWISGEQTSTVFGFGGPPGTGKTTLAKGISKCLINDSNEHPIIFIAIGGSSNGSTLEGHNYTYVGSTWGKIVEGLMSSKCMNPIIYIDELDKISKTEHGREIIGILIHLTDPSQNNEFQDKYFSGIDLDLSKCLIIFSYNNIDDIDKILLDRIHHINTKSLSKYDKINITQKFILPEIYKSLSLSENDIFINEKAITHIIENYTFESGVRKLKEKLYELMRELNIRILKNEYNKLINVNINVIDNILGDYNKINLKKINDKPQIARICGMYASSYGSGGITIIECSKSISEQRLALELTGKQGDVMKESMRVSKTLAWSLISEDNKIKIRSKEPFGIHIHCPEAAVSKDGPSAGVAITICIISLLVNIPIKHDISITGEVDLNGNILAIGGLESKLEGAKNAGIRMALYPKENNKDFNKIIEENKLLIDENFSVKEVSSIYEVINIMFDHTCIKPSFIESK